MCRAARTKGFFVSFDYSEDAEREVTRFWKEEQRTIILLTVKELLRREFCAQAGVSENRYGHFFTKGFASGSKSVG